MRILLLSDTHGYTGPDLIPHLEGANEIWHAGDIGSLETADFFADRGTFRAVYGNIDDHRIRSVYPENLIFSCEGIRVLMTHIAGYPGRYNARVRKLLTAHRPDLMICGHSHILKVQKDPKLGHWHFNPGAVGHHGFHHVRTMLRFEIKDGQIDQLAVIELGKRGRLNAH